MTLSVSPSQIGPCTFITRASAQSSISALRMALTPPARSNAWRSTSMQPPAAAAVDVVLAFTQAKG
jgi:hypothetical protein